MRWRRRCRAVPASRPSRRRWWRRAQRSSGCGRRWPSRQWRCTCTREERDADSSAGPVPPRVHGEVKAGLLTLIDQAELAGWSTRQAARVLDVDPERVRRWRHRHRSGGGLSDQRPGGAVHGVLPAERDAILALADAWGETDRSHRKLAHRGSRLGLVHVSESTVLRVLTSEKARPAWSRPTRTSGERAVAGLGGVEAEHHLVLRLHPLHPRQAGRGGGHGRGVPLLAHQPRVGGGDQYAHDRPRPRLSCGDRR